MNVGDIISRKIFGIAEHFGVIYQGGNREECRIIHMQPESPGAREARIVSSSLDEFLNGESEFKIHNKKGGHVENSELIARAKAWLKCGSEPYCLFNNNCEHFANWLVYRNPVSIQAAIGAQLIGFQHLTPDKERKDYYKEREAELCNDSGK